MKRAHQIFTHKETTKRRVVYDTYKINRFSHVKKIFLLLFLAGFTLQAQIINTESLRMVTDTSGWTGSIGLNVGFIKNVKDLVRVKNDIHIQYKKQKHLILFVNHIGFERADEADFVNKGVQHLRYNYRFHKQVAWEAFLQNQYNAISKIDYRRLAGTGFRAKLSKSEKYKIYFGSLIMFENEKTTEETPVALEDWRNSSYLSFSFYFNKKMTLVSTTYYQPLLRQTSDYRLSNQSIFTLKLYKNLSFKSTLNLTFDAFPVLDVPKQQYSLSNGLVYHFN